MIFEMGYFEITSWCDHTFARNQTQNHTFAKITPKIHFHTFAKITPKITPKITFF